MASGDLFKDLLAPNYARDYPLKLELAVNDGVGAVVGFGVLGYPGSYSLLASASAELDFHNGGLFLGPRISLEALADHDQGFCMSFIPGFLYQVSFHMPIGLVDDGYDLYVTPGIGFHWLDYFYISAGYNFPIRTPQVTTMEGARISIGVNLY